MDGKGMLESAGGVGVSFSVAPSLERPFFLHTLLSVTTRPCICSDSAKGISMLKSCLVLGAGRGRARLQEYTFPTQSQSS